jgi:hypothetical protein
MMSRLNRRQMLAAVGSAVTVGLAGCAGGDETDTETDAGGDGTDTETETMTETTTETDTGGETANVRVAHFSPDAPNVDVYVDDSRVLSDVPFRAVSEYLAVPTGTRTVQITAAGDRSTVAFEGDIEVAPGDFTIAAVGELMGEDTEFQPLVLTDDNSDVADDTARVRAVHASPDAGPVDITVAESGNALFDGVGFTDSGYQEVPAGTYTLQVRPDTESNDGDVLAEFTVELAGGTVYTAFAGGYLTPDDEPTEEMFDLSLAVDSGAGGGGIVESARVRAAHFSPDAPNVDVLVDGDAVLTDVPFRAVSDYLTVPAGPHQVTITAAGDRETVVFDGELSLEGATDYTLVAAGELTSEDTSFEVLPLVDDNSDPGGNSARLRAVHVSPDAGPVDVTVEAGPVLFDGVPFAGSGAVTVEANDYTAQVRPDTEANDGEVVYDTDVSLNGGTVYTAFAGGYLSPDDEPTDEAFELTVEQDASY